MAVKAEPPPALGPASLESRVAVPDGGRSVAGEAKRASNDRRALAAGLTDPATGFFAGGILGDGASAAELAAAERVLSGARLRAARANLDSKDKRLGTSLSKFEELVRLLPSFRPFSPLEFEGDLVTSEQNELLLIAAAEFIRSRPKRGGGLIRGDTVSDQVSGIRAIVEEHLGRKIIAPSGGVLLRRVMQQMRREDGGARDRDLSVPMRRNHLDALAHPDTPFDISSPGWPTARWALMQTCHQCLLRGGEPGTVGARPGAQAQPFRPALGVTWGSLVWLDPATRRLRVVLREGRLYYLLMVLVRAIKDTKARHKRVPVPIRSLHPIDVPLGDPACPYSAIRRLWHAREHLVPPSARDAAPFFVGPDGSTAVSTVDVLVAIRAGATALGLDPGVFGSSALRRGGASDLRARKGSDGGKAIIVQRGRWCATDIDDIYARASLEEQADASAALSAPVVGSTLEEAVPGWVQPAVWHRS